MKHQLRKFHFTLVEVLIAMGICVVGVVSIMGLFPVGANAARDANMAFYADQAADQMLSLTKYLFLDKDLNDKVAASALTQDYVFEIITGWDIEDTGTYSAQSKPAAAEPGNWSDPGFALDPAHATFASHATFADSTSKTYIEMLASAGTVIHNDGWNLYRLGFITKKGADDIEDFACVIRLWATPVHVDELDDTSLKLPRIATIHAEVSWPVGIPYARRQKAEYSLDIFVP